MITMVSSGGVIVLVGGIQHYFAPIHFLVVVILPSSAFHAFNTNHLSSGRNRTLPFEILCVDNLRELIRCNVVHSLIGHYVL